MSSFGHHPSSIRLQACLEDFIIHLMRTFKRHRVFSRVIHSRSFQLQFILIPNQTNTFLSVSLQLVRQPPNRILLLPRPHTHRHPLRSSPSLIRRHPVQPTRHSPAHASSRPPDKLFSSPYYRCLQTLAPYISQRAAKDPSTVVTIEPGLGGVLRASAVRAPSRLQESRSWRSTSQTLSAESEATIVPEVKGESIVALHDRVAFCLSTLISRLDADPQGPRGDASVLARGGDNRDGAGLDGADAGGCWGRGLQVLYVWG